MYGCMDNLSEKNSGERNRSKKSTNSGLITPLETVHMVDTHLSSHFKHTENEIVTLSVYHVTLRQQVQSLG